MAGACSRSVRPGPDVVAGRLDGADESARPVTSAGSGSSAVSVARLTVAVSTPGVLPQEPLDAVDAGRAGHALDREGDLELRRGRSRRCPSYCLGVYHRLPSRETGRRPVGLTATMPGPWGPIHVAATRRGVVAVAWLTTAEAFERVAPGRLHGRSSSPGRARGDPRRALSTRAIRARSRPPGRHRRRERRAGRPARPAGLGPAGPRRRPRHPVGRDRVSYGEIARRIGAPRRRAGRRRRRRPEPDQPAHPVPPGDRGGRHPRRIRRRRLGRARGTPRHQARSARCAKASPSPRAAARLGQARGSRRRASGRMDERRRSPLPRRCSPSSASATSASSGSPSSISTAGSSLTDLAAGIWVYRETDSALAVGLTLMATAVPSLVVGLLAGVYVDRHDRQKIMIVTCLIQSVIVALIAVAVELDSIVGLYAFILLNAGVEAVLRPGLRHAHPRDGDGRGAERRQRVPVDRLVRVHGDRVRRRRACSRARSA